MDVWNIDQDSIIQRPNINAHRTLVARNYINLCRKTLQIINDWNNAYLTNFFDALYGVKYQSIFVGKGLQKEENYCKD
ncbi:hypothetical protein YYG_00016 [Plasmodium vinckei petteri]|uniref:Uncharacterized protein n=1 Tax=Plasmodium vinckei petteri TaxID=138298 RepID=W7AZL0_PLAVN|nr:hypothetical protein YYG_00016 [Plasmodium vinckei petteri]